MKQVTLIIILTLFSGINFFCNSTESKSKTDKLDSAKVRKSSSTTDTSKKRRSAKETYTQIKKILNVDDINSGFTGTQIQIWFEYAASDSGKVIVLKNQNDLWHSVIHYYKFTSDLNNEFISIDKRSEEKNPTSGWNNFSKEINDFGLYYLKDYSEISNYSICNDGDALIVEVVRNNKYKVSMFPCYDVYDGAIKQVKDLTNFLILIQKEFGYKIFPRPPIKKSDS